MNDYEKWYEAGGLCPTPPDMETRLEAGEYIIPLSTWRKPIIYIIGPVSGIKDDNRPAFETMRERLQSELPDCSIRIPHDYVPTGCEWGKAMRISIREMTYADCVVALDGTFSSKGASCERDTCTRIGIPLFDERITSIEQIKEAIL